MQRTGLIAKKVGMTRLFDETGRHTPVTILQVQDLEVMGNMTEEKNGYNAVQLGAFNKKAQRVTKSMLGHFKKNKVEPKYKVAEFRVDADQLLADDAKIDVNHFVEGQWLDVTSECSQGKGFAGAMKRWNFGGMRATHGVSISHRAHGSTGQNQDPGKVFKGKKMAGHMGARRSTVQNVKLFKIDAEKGLLLIKGSVPGSKGGMVFVKDAVKKAAPDLSKQQSSEQVEG